MNQSLPKGECRTSIALLWDDVELVKFEWILYE
jgi:hypothetical protein